METLKYFMTSYLLTLIVSYSALAQTAQQEQSFIFSDEFNNTQELILGIDPYGSDDLDPDLGEEFIPQVPQGEFGVRFQLPPDTSITTTKDIRFGCYWATGHEHLVDINYAAGSSSISVFWEWDSLLTNGLLDVIFINPYTGQTIASYSWFSDSSHFFIPPSLDKIKIWTTYNGTLSWEEYEVLAPNGGETLKSEEFYTITWWSNELSPWMSIEFSSDSGNTWNLIADSVWTTNTGYSWQVPQISSEKCLIRIGGYPCRYDVSDSVFTITYPVSTETEDRLPTEFSLAQNYPNPFNPSTKIRFTISDLPAGRQGLRFTSLKVYNVLGNKVATLVNEEKPAGSYEVEFSGTTLPSGIYFYQLKVGSFIQTRKMVLMK
jgi:hypothetical protein